MELVKYFNTNQKLSEWKKMVTEAEIEKLEKMALADTDSDAYFDRLGNAFSEFIENYNSRLVFEKDNARVKPLDRYKLGGSSQRNTLFLLARSGAQSMSALADNVNYDRGNMTKLVDYLVEQGLARRFQQEGNRKQVFVELTDKGRALIKEEGSVFVRNMRDKVRDKLNDAERAELLATVRKATAFLKRI